MFHPPNVCLLIGGIGVCCGRHGITWIRVVPCGIWNWIKLFWIKMKTERIEFSSLECAWLDDLKAPDEQQILEKLLKDKDAMNALKEVMEELRWA